MAIGIISVVWCFFTFVIANVYNSSVISYLSVTYKKPDVSNFQELANHVHFKVVTLEGSICEIDIMVCVIQSI